MVLLGTARLRPLRPAAGRPGVWPGAVAALACPSRTGRRPGLGRWSGQLGSSPAQLRGRAPRSHHPPWQDHHGLGAPALTAVGGRRPAVIRHQARPPVHRAEPNPPRGSAGSSTPARHKDFLARC